MINLCSRKGFTIIELLIVLVIVGILAGVAIPSFHVSLESAREREARTVLNLIYNAQRIYRLDEGEYAAAVNDTGFTEDFSEYIDNPNTTAQYYTFTMSTSTDSFWAQAERNNDSDRQFHITEAGIISTGPH